jgi:hypothetical protein
MLLCLILSLALALSWSLCLDSSPGHSLSYLSVSLFSYLPGCCCHAEGHWATEAQGTGRKRQGLWSGTSPQLLPGQNRHSLSICEALAQSLSTRIQTETSFPQEGQPEVLPLPNPGKASGIDAGYPRSHKWIPTPVGAHSVAVR